LQQVHFVAQAAEAAGILPQDLMVLSIQVAATVGQERATALRAVQSRTQAVAAADTDIGQVQPHMPEAQEAQAVVAQVLEMEPMQSQDCPIQVAAVVVAQLKTRQPGMQPQAAQASSSSVTSDHPAQSAARSQGLAFIRSTHSRHLARSR